MPDLPIVIPDTAVAPKDYTLSGTQELALKTVRALIDGSGAATAFLPTLQLLDPNGHVMWEGATTSTVAAGGSADVSWFPGLGGSGSGTASTTNAHWFLARRTTSITMTAGALTVLPWTDLFSSDSSLFSLVNHTVANGAVQVARAGVVLFQVWLSPSNLEPDFPLQVLLNSSNGVSSAVNTPANQWTSLGLPGGTNRFGPTMWAIQIPDAVPFDVLAQYTNLDAANRVMAQAQMWGLWWPTGTLSPF